MKKEDIYRTINNVQETNRSRLLPAKTTIRVPKPKSEVMECLSAFISNPLWLPEYDDVCSWLEDNKGKGLLCIGNCGRGKTMLCYRIIPILLNYFLNKCVSCYDAIDLNTKIEEIKTKHLICIDDIGTEYDYYVYGVRRQPFVELIDLAEKAGKLMLLTTNLNTEELQEKYGIRVIDRLKNITKVVHFVGDSLRGT